MSGELQPSLGDIRPHGHLKIGRFTQHFVDVLNLDQTPLEFFDTIYPGTPREEQRKYLGRFGISGKMQMQKMSELSDGQNSRVVFAKLGRDAPHILLLDEPVSIAVETLIVTKTAISKSYLVIYAFSLILQTNHLDMESIDSLAKAVNEFEGGMVLVSHDMRLISQVAKEIWVCDNKTITKYKGDIQNFKMDMRAQLHLEDEGKGNKSSQGKLRGDASVMKKTEEDIEKEKKKLKNGGAKSGSNSNNLALDSLLAPKPRDQTETMDAFDVGEIKNSLPKPESDLLASPK